MKNKIISIFIVLIFFHTQGQNTKEDKNLYFKCGSLLGNKNDILNGCSNKIQKQYTNKIGDIYNYCNCMMTLITENYTLKEWEEIMSIKAKDFQSLLYATNNKIIIEQLKNCSKTLIKKAESDYDLTTISNDFGDYYIKSCIYELENDKSINKQVYDINIYCNCLSDEYTKQGLKVDNLKDFKDKNSILFNEIILKCVKKSKLKLVIKKENDIITNNKTQNLDIISINSLNKVKVSIGKIEKYFIIDSGASDISINNEFETQLLLAGIIKKENYLENRNYMLADGSIIDCKRVKLNNIKIGDFIVNNVTISIINSQSNDFLLGKSFLDKFKIWIINNEKSKLYLESDK